MNEQEKKQIDPNEIIDNAKGIVTQGGELSPEETELIRKMDEERSGEDFALTEDEEKLLESIQKRYKETEVTHTIEQSFKTAFRTLRDYVKESEAHEKEVANINGGLNIYSNEYIVKKQEEESYRFHSRVDSISELLRLALRDLKLNLIAKAAELNLADTVFSTSLTLIVSAGTALRAETVQQTAENFRGNVAMLTALAGAAEKQGVDAAPFHKLIFDPVQKVGHMEMELKNLTQHLGESGQAKYRGIMLGEELEKLAYLCKVELTPWDMEVVANKNEIMFGLGFEGINGK